MITRNINKSFKENPPSSVVDDEEDPPPPPRRIDWFNKLVSLQPDGETTDKTIHSSSSSVQSNNIPSNLTPQGRGRSSSLILKKFGLGFLGAAHACVVLLLVAAVAVAVGVGLVRFWLEEPIFLKEKLHFDYTHIHPKAVYSFCGLGSSSNGVCTYNKSRGLKRIIPTALSTKVVDNRIPMGHMFQVSVGLLMPESEYNRQVGVFQLTAEILTESGQVIAKSSEPCMLRFRSLPIRLMRVFVLGVPILLGITTETQKLRIVVLRHKELSTSPRTDSIRVTLIPRAGTLSPPQLYEAEIFVKSQLPFFKEIVHRWKWTFYVWASMNIYIMMLLIMLCFCKPLVLSGPMLGSFQLEHRSSAEQWMADDHEMIMRDEVSVAVPDQYEHPKVDGDDLQGKDISELLRRLQRSRSKRKAAFLLYEEADPAGSCTGSSVSVNPSAVYEEVEVEDSKSVCCG